MWIIGKKYVQKPHVLLGALNMSKVLVGYNFLFILFLSLICILQDCQDLTEAGAYPQLPTQPIFFDYLQTNIATYYGHCELSREE